jgi:hypothetical protein
MFQTSDKEQLRQTLAALDPVRLLSEIREAQRRLAQLEVGIVNAETAQSPPELSGFVASLSTVWRDGEVRPTHRKRTSGPRTYRTPYSHSSASFLTAVPIQLYRFLENDRGRDRRQRAME